MRRPHCALAARAEAGAQREAGPFRGTGAAIATASTLVASMPVDVAAFGPSPAAAAPGATVKVLIALGLYAITGSWLGMGLLAAAFGALLRRRRGVDWKAGWLRDAGIGAAAGAAAVSCGVGSAELARAWGSTADAWFAVGTVPPLLYAIRLLWQGSRRAGGSPPPKDGVS